MSASVSGARPMNLAEGARTYVAAMKVKPDFAAVQETTDRGQRKQLAVGAIESAEARVARTLTPQLDALRGQGLVSSYEFIPRTGALVVNVPDANAGAAYQALQGIGELGRIVRNREIGLDSEPLPPNVPPREPDAGKAAAPEYNVDIVNAPEVWASGVTGKGVTVGIIDTGLDSAHGAVKARYRGTNADGTVDHNYNFVDTYNGKPEAYDDHGHGTHVGGTIAGGTPEKIIGMAPDAKIISAKVFSSGGISSTDKILKGLSWMLKPTDSSGQNADATKAPDIVSNSWGNRVGSTLSYLDVFKAFDAAGIVPIVSAGNSGPRAGTIGAPASYAQAIAVGATDKNDKIASFSSRGPSPIKDEKGQPIFKPDVSAPGVSVMSSLPGGRYGTMSGTSMSAPAVSGITALILSKFPELTNEQVRQALTSSAVDLGAAGPDPEFGHGRVDAVQALEAAGKIAAASKR